MSEVIEAYHAIAAKGGDMWERSGRLRKFREGLSNEQRDELRRELAHIIAARAKENAR